MGSDDAMWEDHSNTEKGSIVRKEEEEEKQALDSQTTLINFQASDDTQKKRVVDLTR